MVKGWADDINAAARNTGYRPQSLLVFLNPVGGRMRAREIWAAQVLPIFQLAGSDLSQLAGCMRPAMLSCSIMEALWAAAAEWHAAGAGIECKVVETKHAQHAAEAVQTLSLQELRQLDGVLAVRPC